MINHMRGAPLKTNVKKPISTEITIPVTSTGPAMINIFEQRPPIIPSRLCSMAGDIIELAKPVIGIIAPAPPNSLILSYTPMQVRVDAIKNKDTETRLLIVDSDR